MRTAIENLPLIFYVIDSEGIFRLSIGAGLKGLGLEQNQVCGSSAFEIYRDFPVITSALREALAGNTATFESRGWVERLTPIYACPIVRLTEALVDSLESL